MINAYDDDCMVAEPTFTLDGNICGFSIAPVEAWRVDGTADSGKLIPIFDGGYEPDGLYAIGYPDGSFRFPDGERCSEDKLFEAFWNWGNEPHSARRSAAGTGLTKGQKVQWIKNNLDLDGLRLETHIEPNTPGPSAPKGVRAGLLFPYISMVYSKAYLPVADQLALIKGRGMIVSDDALAQAYLNKIGYYRLSGYWYPYRRSADVQGETVVEDQFRDNTKFSEIVDLYVFDKKLRLLMLDIIERIEIALRVQITLRLGQRGSHAHRDRNALHPNFAQRPDTTTGEIAHEKWLQRHDEAFRRSREEFAKHFKTKYVGEHPPIWIAAELWDFGAMSFLYSGMRKPDQEAVAQAFGVKRWEVMSSWLHHINVARNVCAHHSRFWNKPNTARPVWPTAAECPDLGHIAQDTKAKARVYGLACLSAYLLRSINPNSEWSKRFKSVTGSFPASSIVNLQAAGFPKDWDKTNLWS